MVLCFGVGFKVIGFVYVWKKMDCRLLTARNRCEVMHLLYSRRVWT